MKKIICLSSFIILISLNACGGGTNNSDSSNENPITNPSNPVIPDLPTDTNNNNILNLTPCEPSGKGIDYQVGSAKNQLATLDLVPWNKLSPGDTVRIFWKDTAYKGKFLLAAKGTQDKPVRVCGVKGPNGERPVIDGDGATTRADLDFGHPLFQSRSIITIKQLASDDWTAYPSYIQIDGLKIQKAHPNNSFKDTTGTTQSYVEFGACIWVQRGVNITVADNEITDCSQAIFSNSVPDGDFSVTKNLRIAGNYMYNNGIVNGQSEHTTYIQSIGAVYEFNIYGPMRTGATGNSIKDRSAGTIIRFNRIEDGAHAIDLVEAEDYIDYAKADPRYRTTFVYGNQITKNGEKGTTIHYGGDHMGSESSYRKGTLYFWNNTVLLTGNGYGVLFQLSTIDETAEVWNNIFMFSPTVPYPSMRAMQDNADNIESGGILNLGKNWIDSRCADSDPYHPINGKLNGSQNMITGTGYPVDTNTFIPKDSSVVIDNAQSNLNAVTAYPLNYQLSATKEPMERKLNGKTNDLGAVEK